MFHRDDLDITQNSLGRNVPKKIGDRSYIPYVDHIGIAPEMEREIGRPMRHRIKGRSKILHSIDDAIEITGLSDGMTISFHHNLRNGDMVLNMVMDRISKKGIKDLRLFPSALFPVHEPIIDHIKNGIVTSIEGSLNGPIGSYISK